MDVKKPWKYVRILSGNVHCSLLIPLKGNGHDYICINTNDELNLFESNGPVLKIRAFIKKYLEILIGK